MVNNLLEIKLREQDSFLKIVETLTRIGIETKDKTLIQTCHILHKREKYYICHFKELFILDKIQKNSITDEDIHRRNAIAKLLQQWNLCNIVEPEKAQVSTMKRLKIIPHKEKPNYMLKQNYTIGKRKTVE